MCTFLLNRGSNKIWFVGTKSHASVAEYAYGTLTPIVDKLSDKEYYAYLGQCQREGCSWKAHGFRPAWLQAFVTRINERFFESRKAAIAEAPNESTALVRLNGALAKVDKYIEDKFASTHRHVEALKGAKYHAAGREAGRAAADRVPLGRRGVEGLATKLIGGR